MVSPSLNDHYQALNEIRESYELIKNPGEGDLLIVVVVYLPGFINFFALLTIFVVGYLLFSYLAFFTFFDTRTFSSC